MHGLAVGDALGAGTEFETPASIARKHGRIQGYVQGVNPAFRPGDFTDDTQMTLCVLAAYAEARRSGGDLLEITLRRCLEWLDAGPPDVGVSTAAALRAAKTEGIHGGLSQWLAGGAWQAGNGGLMRAAAPVIAGRRGENLRREIVGLTALTHPDPRSLAACLVLAVALESLLDGAGVEDAWQIALEELDRYPLDIVIGDLYGSHWAGVIADRLPDARAAVRYAVFQGVQGVVESQSGFVLHTLQVAAAASTAPDFLAGILPIVERGDDSDTAAAVAGSLLGARGLPPPPHLLQGLRGGFGWSSWPWVTQPAAPALAAFVLPYPEGPGSTDATPADLDRPDPEEEDAHARNPKLPWFEFDEVAPRVLAGRDPLFVRNVRTLRARGVTHLLDLREEHEWAGPDRFGRSGLEEVRRLGLGYLNVPIRDGSVPALEALTAAVTFIEAALDLGGTVYVHCRGGQERTGAVLAAWYARARRVGVGEAMAVLKQRRPPLCPSPSQLDAVARWLRIEGTR